jgi:hypothetical protein
VTQKCDQAWWWNDKRQRKTNGIVECTALALADPPMLMSKKTTGFSLIVVLAEIKYDRYKLRQARYSFKGNSAIVVLLNDGNQGFCVCMLKTQNRKISNQRAGRPRSTSW